MHFHLARFDLAEFQQAVDLIDQSLGVIEKILEILSLQCRDLTRGCAQKQTRIADDRAHRRAQFVVYVGEKLRLVLVGDFQLLSFLSQVTTMNLQLFKQMGMLERYDGLVCESRQRFDFPFIERLNLSTVYVDGAD